jgi:hypothetical protein
MFFVQSCSHSARLLKGSVLGYPEQSNGNEVFAGVPIAVALLTSPSNKISFSGFNISLVRFAAADPKDPMLTLLFG